MPIRRVRHRYLKIRVVSEQRYSMHEVDDDIQRGVLRIYGVRGLSEVAPMLIEFDEEEQTGILRCSHLRMRRMRASLAYITSMHDSAAAIHVVRISGTIKALRLK